MRIPIPSVIVVDEAVEDHPRVRSLLDLLPRIPVQTVPAGEPYEGKGWWITRNLGSFLRPCPGQKGHVCCGYWTMEWMLGCPFRCEYCALQAYRPSGSLTLYANLEDGLEEIRELRQKRQGPIRLGTGEFGDSLAMEPFFPFVRDVVEAVGSLDDMVVELKTKSNWIEPLQDLPHRERIIVAFSLNPPDLIYRYETGAATLDERLSAISRVLGWGYRVAVHFDPILQRHDWLSLYGEVVDRLATILPAEKLAWISMGTFRFPKGMDDAILKSYPETDLFRPEFIRARDNKMRYPRPVREMLYRGLLTVLEKHYPRRAIYLCMESPDVWNRVFGELMNSARLTARLDER
ncbi:MAG TPA: radical SAM protein [Thermoanaerobaculia bacterium]|nr:radical SAM protein [Thermoanaerobaculia bacterium]HUM30052.1 radical SAM protein [Thermoanaerobaculia bacterium]HXK68259.1 radical SAM protein [Thermoanaerobaculia bacterium]